MRLGTESFILSQSRGTELGRSPFFFKASQSVMILEKLQSATDSKLFGVIRYTHWRLVRVRNAKSCKHSAQDSLRGNRQKLGGCVAGRA